MWSYQYAAFTTVCASVTGIMTVLRYFHECSSTTLKPANILKQLQNMAKDGIQINAIETEVCLHIELKHGEGSDICFTNCPVHLVMHVQFCIFLFLCIVSCSGKCGKQEALLTLRGQCGRCRNIIGNPKILGISPSPRLHPLFPLGVILWWAFGNPSCVPNLKSLASAIV